MEFGLFVPCHRFDDRVSVAELYDQALETVRLADDAGFTTAWFPEHHLVQYYASPSPLMWMVMRLFKNQAVVKGGFTEPEPVEDEYTKEQLLENLVAGSPATCVEKVRAYEQLGVDQFILYGAFGPDHARTMASLRRFAEDVMPHFAKGSQS
jgi:alkanesulfonate monooxygenase SsuD/methylene tetrahydromethanopterin reductase-like flavin-dependent oxidoreductase (luciferase family)